MQLPTLKAAVKSEEFTWTQPALQTLSSQDLSAYLQDYCNHQCSSCQETKSLPHLPINTALAHQILKSLELGHSSFYEGQGNLISLHLHVLPPFPLPDEHHMLFHMNFSRARANLQWLVYKAPLFHTDMIAS